MKLRSLREERKINQQKIAMDLQISQASVSKYEIGSAEPDIGTIVKLAEYFNVSTDYLLGVSEIKLPLTKSDLSDMEIEHLVAYRSLSKIQKEKVCAYIQGILDESEIRQI
jgi:transcriptional regulator with XRE-family HTH domain